MANITMPGVDHKAESRDGFQISWQEPPMGPEWSANVAPETPRALALMARNGAQVVKGRTREEMLANAHKYIDGVLTH